MAVITPPVIASLPAAPDPNDRATFNARAYPWSTALASNVAQHNAVATNVAANATDAADSATEAATQAVLATTNGAAQVTLATTQAGNAATSAGTATTQAGIATTQATASGVSATASEASRIAASKLNLGNKATAPTVDNQGAALLQGATYYDTVLNKWRVWTGVSWGDGISAIAGVSSVNGLPGDVVLKTVNGTAITGAGDIPIPLIAEIITPTNTSPANAATAIGETPTLTGSAFFSLYSATHANTQVQVHTSSVFTSPLYDSGIVAAAVSFTMTSAILSVSTAYFWRIRYKSNRGTWSDWSTATSFTTASAFNNYITTPTATPAAFGDSFEGGFYAGMIWNELVQSSTSMLIATGSKAFAVPSMSGAPIAYAGQTLEVRSRANPANKMVGTVIGASGTTLTINVTSVGGSGTFTDWSIMARYRIIKAPKSSGESASLAYKNSNDAAPVACQTLTEGRKATLAMVAAGSASVYPAAHFCYNLTIGGRSDWYLGARDENELDWRNLKPTADNNYTSVDRPTGATPDYKNLGSYGDAANTHGLNNNSSPTGAAYTATVPSQVASGKNFRTGESEANAYGSFRYWSASEYSASDAWLQYWTSSFPGYQANFSKSNAYYVRAVRRSII